jgi:hypothetical protein
MRQTTLITALIAMLVNTTACAHTSNQKFEKALSEGRCEEGLENIPGKDGKLNFGGRVNQTGGSLLSYTATGAGYTADVILTVVGGAVIFVALCAPIAAAVIASNGGGNAVSGAECLPADLSQISPPHFGRDLYQGTAQMRCPDLTLLSRSIRRVAACQEKRASSENLLAARKTLSSITNNNEFMKCIATDERKSLEVDASRLDNKIASASSSSR